MPNLLVVSLIMVVYVGGIVFFLWDCSRKR